jgi:prepilin-type N-terminal cleavage/methylation domain-containing protein
MNIRASAGFSLVELLVVITILAIISTVAFTSLSGSTDKARNSKRLEHMSTMETALQLFRQEKQYLPLPNASATTNAWGYNSAAAALKTNTGSFTLNADGAITVVTSGSGGGTVSTTTIPTQIGAKGVMEQSLVGKQYLSTDIADPSADTKVGANQTLKDFGIGRYVYAVFAKPPASGAWNADTKSATSFNIAATIIDEQKGYITKIGGDFDDKNSGCSTISCPTSLIGPGGAVGTTLKDGDNGTANIPYSIKY